MSAVLLDTSALLAHYFDEAECQEASEFLESEEVLICAVSRVEMHGRLREIGVPPGTIEDVLAMFTALATEVVAVDDDVARRACEIRAAASARLPLVDSLIAAAASTKNAKLIHRDPHFRAVPQRFLVQHELGTQA